MRRRITSLLVASLVPLAPAFATILAPTARAETPPPATLSMAPASMTEFGDAIIAAFRATRPELSPRRSDDGASIDWLDKAGTVVVRSSLERTYDDYLHAAPSDRPAVVARIARALAQTSSDAPEDWASIEPRIMPVVRAGPAFEAEERGIAAQADASTKGPPPTFPRRLFVDPLYVGLAVDSPDTMSRVTAADLAAWPIDRDAALAKAIAHLEAASHDAFKEARPGLWLSDNGDGYDAARILLVERIGKLSVKGAPLVLAPSRDLLVVTGDQDPEGIAIMLGLGARAAATARAIAAPVYRLEHGAWVAFRAPPTDPVLTAIAKWNTEAWVGLYADQKEPLQAAVGDDVFVATLTGYEDQAGRPFTLAVWTQGLTTLLPRADLVGIVRMEQHPGAEPTGSVVGFVRWDKLVAVLGPRLAPAGTTPERWRVSAVASDDDLRRLAVEAAPSALAP